MPKIYAFLLVLPELSTPPRFRIQGGYPERDIHTYIGVAGRYFSFLILDKILHTRNTESHEGKTNTKLDVSYIFVFLLLQYLHFSGFFINWPWGQFSEHSAYGRPQYHTIYIFFRRTMGRRRIRTNSPNQ